MEVLADADSAAPRLLSSPRVSTYGMGYLLITSLLLLNKGEERTCALPVPRAAQREAVHAVAAFYGLYAMGLEQRELFALPPAPAHPRVGACGRP